MTYLNNINEIHENAIERLSHVILQTRDFCGDEQAAIDDFFAEENAAGPVRFFPLEQAVVVIEATLRAYELERQMEGRPEDD